MRAYFMRPACDAAQASVGASLSHTQVRGRYNHADPDGHELRPGRPASQPLGMLLVGGSAACRAARKRRSRL